MGWRLLRCVISVWFVDGALTESDVPPYIKQEGASKAGCLASNLGGEEKKQGSSSRNKDKEEKSDSTIMVVSIVLAAIVAFAAVEYAGGQAEPRAAFNDVPSGTEAGVPSQGVVSLSLLARARKDC